MERQEPGIAVNCRWKQGQMGSKKGRGEEGEVEEKKHIIK